MVHNSVYFKWFELGRMEILEQIIPLEQAMRLGIGAVVIRNTCAYHAPARYPDPLILTTRALFQETYQGKFTFLHSLTHRKSHQLIADGETVLTIIDTRTYTLIKEIPPFVIQNIRGLTQPGAKEVP